MTAVQPIATAGSKDVSALRGERMPRLLLILTSVTALGVVFGLYMALVYAGTEVLQGHVQRIFYIHVPAFFGAFVAFAAAVVGGIMYLRSRDVKWDRLALAGVEIGLALALVNVITGAIWARPIWNTWWTWDPRLTASAIMALTYAAYLMLRQGIENPDQQRRFASVYGILAFTTVIITLVITRIRPDTIHPVVIGTAPTNPQGMFDVAATAGVRAALYANMLVWGVLVPVTLIWHRVRLEKLAERVNALKISLLEK